MNVKVRIFLILGVFCVFGVHGAHHKRRYRDTAPYSPNNDKCDFSTLETKLQNLQAELEQKVNLLRQEIRSSANRLEQRTIATKNTMIRYLNDAAGQTGRNNQAQPTHFTQNSNLDKDVHFAVSSLKLLLNDLERVKQNISRIMETTNSIKDELYSYIHVREIFNPSPTHLAIQSESTPSSCLEIKEKGALSGIYLVQPKNTNSPFFVYCNMELNDGGWLTIHQRTSGDVDFYRNWQDYKVGFGNIAGEHWLGLEHIYEITGNEIHELLVELMDENNITKTASYSLFSIGSEEEGYALKVLGTFDGDAGDSLSYHAGSKFSTKDKDQDSWIEGSCAQSHGGGWWYKSCDRSNLNGRYLLGKQADFLLYQPMYWDSFGGPQIGLASARMLIRPRQKTSTSLAWRYRK